jgi:hypothetical protein
MKTASLVSVFLATTLAAGLASAAPQPIDVAGSAAPQQAPADQVIVITAATRHVNVTGGSTVRFEANGRAFTWNFQNGTEQVIPFDLARIAPQGVLDHPVTTYVSENPLYRSN